MKFYSLTGSPLRESSVFQGATHEAAHTIIALALGAEVLRVSLFDDNKGDTTVTFDDEFPRIVKAVFYAGLAFDSLHLTPPHACHQARGDARLLITNNLNDTKYDLPAFSRTTSEPAFDEAVFLFNDPNAMQYLWLNRFLLEAFWIHFISIATLLEERRALTARDLPQLRCPNLLARIRAEFQLDLA